MPFIKTNKIKHWSISNKNNNI